MYSDSDLDSEVSVDTDECCFCSTINVCKFVPTRIPAREGECPSLLEQCLSHIAATPALLEPDQVRSKFLDETFEESCECQDTFSQLESSFANKVFPDQTAPLELPYQDIIYLHLPVPVLEELKFYLTDDALFRLSDLFREKGIDASPAWEALLYKRFGYRFLEMVTPWSGKPVWKIAEDSHNPRQLYMFELCKILTRCAMFKTDRGSEKQLCGPCFAKFSSYLSSLSSFHVPMRQLSWIIKADTDLTKALKLTLERVIDLELKLDVDLFDREIDTDPEAVNFVKQLIAGNKLQSLGLGPLHPMTGKCNQLLNDLFSTDEAKEGSKPGETGVDSEEMDSGDECEKREFDIFASRAERKRQTRIVCLANLREIREKIQVLKQSQGDTQERQEGLQSLKVNLFGGFLARNSVNLVNLGKLLQAYKPIKRLSYTSREKHGWNVLCAMVGAGQLTHLMVAGPQTVFFLLIAVLFENYRCDDGISPPMEFLGFYDVTCAHPYDEGKLNYHHPVAAVKRLHLSHLDISVSMVSHLHLLLRYNTALTHLDLESVGLDAQLKLSSVFSAISKHRTLETLNLCNSDQDYTDLYMLNFRTTKDENALVGLLRTNPQLKNLVLKGCRVSKQFVSSDTFLKAVKNHKGLEYLSLSYNKLETAGVALLLALREPLATSSLKGLGLDNCQIPGPKLLEAARTISEGRPSGRLFLQYLSLCNNKVNKDDHLELQSYFATCVRLPHIEGGWEDDLPDSSDEDWWMEPEDLEEEEEEEYEDEIEHLEEGEKAEFKTAWAYDKEEEQEEEEGEEEKDKE